MSAWISIPRRPSGRPTWGNKDTNAAVPGPLTSCVLIRISRRPQPWRRGPQSTGSVAAPFVVDAP
eukprot:8362628-Pyramimonas_sp.AAC.1